MEYWSSAMSRHLGSRYEAIKSPWADYAIYSLPDASRIDACDRQPLMDAMNGIIAVNWQATEPHWTATPTFWVAVGSMLAASVSAYLAFLALHSQEQKPATGTPAPAQTAQPAPGNSNSQKQLPPTARPSQGSK